MSRAEVFERVYRTNAWGGTRGQHYSGRGSDAHFAVPYATAVCAFLRRVRARAVVDLGCGDFRVGSHLTADQWTYTGVEIVDEVVRRNADKRRGPGVRATKGSGVVLHEPPFSWPLGEPLLSVPANWTKSEMLVTTIYTPTAWPAKAETPRSRCELLEAARQPGDADSFNVSDTSFASVRNTPGSSLNSSA
jgi:hypothetical protein